MPNTIPSANMSLPIPVVNRDPGPTYAFDLNQCFLLLDEHTHQSGSGVAISPAGININADLPFGGNNATSLRSLRFTPQSAVLAAGTDLGCLYEVTNDLYYNDGLGNQIRLTQSGAVAGTPGSISSLTSPASASYNAGTATFIWQSAANTPANMDLGSLILRNVTSGSFGLTLQPHSLSVDYVLTLPFIPVSATQVMTLDTSGVMSSQSYDAVAAAMSATGANAIVSAVNSASAANSLVALTTVTTNTSNPGLGGCALSISSGTYTNTNNGNSDEAVLNLAVTVTSSGRPIELSLQASTTGGGAITKSNATSYSVKIKRSATVVAFYFMPSGQFLSAGCIRAVDTIAPAGVNNYTVTVNSNGSGQITVTDTVMLGREIVV